MPTETLRPSGDRTRERVFNWLNSEITGAHCIDLFAGSGALAFEALSRGAKSCLAVDNDPRAIEWLRYNIVFVDPPFNTYSLLELCQDLENQQWLLSEAKIYIESSRSSSEICTPRNWMLWRHKVSGRVDMRLYTRSETKS